MNKTTIVSLAIIAGLVLTLVIVKNRDTSPVPGLSGWKEKSDEISIRKGDERLLIRLDGGIWKINSEAYPADPDVVAKMEKSLNELKLSDLITEKPHYEQYDLIPEKGIAVTVKSGDRMQREVLIGKASSTRRHTYIRLGRAPEVYLAMGNLWDVFNKSLEEVRDKQVMKVDRKSIQGVEIAYKGGTLVLNRRVLEMPAKGKTGDEVKQENKKESTEKKPVEKVEQWYSKTHPAERLDRNRIEQFLAAFDPLKASGYPALDKRSLKGRICSVRITAADKVMNVVIHEKRENNRYVCTSSESPFVFSLDEWQAKRLMKGPDDFREEKK